MTMSALTVEEKNDSLIEHALKMRSAWSLSNYHSFFQLYSTAPNMGGYLLDLFVQRERERAIKTLIKSWVLSFLVARQRQPGVFCCKGVESSDIEPFIAKNKQFVALKLAVLLGVYFHTGQAGNMPDHG